MKKIQFDITSIQIEGSSTNSPSFFRQLGDYFSSLSSKELTNHASPEEKEGEN